MALASRSSQLGRLLLGRASVGCSQLLSSRGMAGGHGLDPAQSALQQQASRGVGGTVLDAAGAGVGGGDHPDIKLPRAKSPASHFESITAAKLLTFPIPPARKSLAGSASRPARTISLACTTHPPPAPPSTLAYTVCTDHRPRGEVWRPQLPPAAGGAQPRAGHLHVGRRRQALL